MVYIEPLKGDRIVCVNIGKTYNIRESLYDATRHYWRLNGNRAQLATHVIGVVNGLAEIGKILNVDLKDLITDKEERE